jgi:D-methionine transport system ATP-binding protein
VYSLTFAGTAAGKPALAEALQKFKISANILAANIIELKKEPFGLLVVAFSGDRREIDGALDYLRALGVLVKNWGGLN